MVNTLISNNRRNLTEEEADRLIKDYLADTCKNILKNTAVFKDDENGRLGIDRFMKKVGY